MSEERKLKYRVKELDNYLTLREIIDAWNSILAEHPEASGRPVMSTFGADGYIGIEYESYETDSEVRWREEHELKSVEARRKQYEVLKKEFEPSS